MSRGGTAPDVSSERWSSRSGGMMREIDQGRLLAGIASTSHDCILCLAADGQILWASAATEQMLGWRPEELAGGPLGVLLPGEQDGLRAVLERLVAGERLEPFVETGVRRDGSMFQAEVTLGPVLDREESVTGIVVILRDVSAQQREQSDLALALEMSRAHFDQAATPQALLDLSGHLESVNPAWCELFGHGEGWFADCELLDLVHPLDAENVEERLGRLGAGAIDSVSYRGLFRNADGFGLSLLLDAALLREPDGRPYAIAASVGDLIDDRWIDPQHPATHDHLSEVLARRSWDSAVLVDEALTMTHVTPAAARLLRYDPEDLLRHLTLEYVHPGDTTVVMEMLERLLAKPHRPERAVLRVRDGEGEWRWVEVTATNCLADQEIGGIAVNLRDVTEQVRTDEALRLSEALHRAMVETAPEGILATSPDGRVIFANETAAQLVGRPVEELYGEDPAKTFGLPTTGSHGDVEVHEVVHVRPDGDQRILEIARRPLGSRRAGIGSLVSVSDVTEARNAERVLRQQALHDPLTTLPNRYLFEDRLVTAAARQQRSRGRGTAVLFADLDGFKQVNDRSGHAVGDAVLREVASRLLASVRASDTVGRLGGDEFAVVCEDAELDEALLVADRILAAVAEPVRVDDVEYAVSLSIGVALSPPCEFDELVIQADQAMYRAKELGGGRIAVAGQ